MKKLYFYLSLITLLLAASCCDDKLCDGTLSNKEDASSNLGQLEELLIDAHTVCINTAQAECVSQLFMRRENSSAATRSTFASKEPKNSFSITKSDSVLAYVVNYENGGFTIVSATKKYAPILAFSENGEITETDLDGNGLGFWKDCITADIIKSEYQIQPNTAEYAEVRSQWRDYEKPMETMAISKTHVPNNATDWYIKLRNQMMTEVGMCEERRQDFYYYAFSIFGTICNQKENEARYQENDRKLAITYANETYVPPCFVWGYGVSNLKSHKVGPFLKTYWDQGVPYNSYLPNYPTQPAGCVCIATSQIMNYYQFPDVLDGVAINWDLTQVETATSTDDEVFKLIKVVNTGVKTTENGGSNIDKANAFFTRNNYATTIINSANVLEEHIKNELKVNKPVFIGGMPSTGTTGHAFVCDGYIEYTRDNKLSAYELLYTNNRSFTESPYVRVFNKAKTTIYEKYFHMNWGWGILYKDNTLPAYFGGNTIGWFRSIFETEYPKNMQILKVYPKQ